MSRNLAQTKCEFCNGRVVLVEKPRPITPDDAGGYFDEYDGMIVAHAECEDCHGKYLAWIDERDRKHYPSRRPATDDDPNAFFDLSFRSSFNDEPGLEDWYTVDPRIAEARRLRQRAIELEDEAVHKPCRWDELRSILMGGTEPMRCATCGALYSTLTYNDRRLMVSHYRHTGTTTGRFDEDCALCDGSHKPPQI